MAALAVASVLAIGLGAGAWFWLRSNADGPEVAGSFAPAPDELCESLRQEALGAVDRLEKEFPEDIDVLYSKAIVAKRFGNRELAVAYWKKCLKLDAGFALAHYCLGWNALEQGGFQQAAAELHEARKLDPKNAHVDLLLSQALFELDRREEAVAALEEHVRKSPGSLEGHLRLAQAYAEAKQVEKAQQHFGVALEIYPACKQAWEGLAEACAKLGQVEEEKKCREMASRHAVEPSKPPEQQDSQQSFRHAAAFALTDVGKVYLAFGRKADAESRWLRAAEIDPQDAESRKQLVSLYEPEGRFPDAVRVLKELTQIEPRDPLHYINLAVLSKRTGDVAIAEAAFRKIQELAPRSPDGYSGLAELYLQAGRNLPDAPALAQKAVELAPTAVNHYILGAALLRNERRDEALKSLRRAAELDPQNKTYRDVLARFESKP